MPDGRTAYTRDGSFERDAQGQLVTHDGYLVDPGITVPQNASAITISARRARCRHHRRADRAADARPDPARPLRQQGRPRVASATTSSSRPPPPARRIDGNPDSEGFGNLQQGYLEEANVNAVTEISSLIAAQRAYEMNSKVVTAADQMLSATTPDVQRLRSATMTIQLCVSPINLTHRRRITASIMVRVA